jgi:hypothetical protein
MYRPTTGPEVFRSLRPPDFENSAIEGGKFVSPRHRPPLTPKEIFLELISVAG